MSVSEQFNYAEVFTTEEIARVHRLEFEAGLEGSKEAQAELTKLAQFHIPSEEEMYFGTVSPQSKSMIAYELVGGSAAFIWGVTDKLFIISATGAFLLYRGIKDVIRNYSISSEQTEGYELSDKAMKYLYIEFMRTSSLIKSEGKM